MITKKCLFKPACLILANNRAVSFSFAKISKGDHFTVDDFMRKKTCYILYFYKNFENTKKFND